MAVRLWRAIRRIIMSRRRKSKVNYRELNEDSSDDDFTPSLKKSKQLTTKKNTRLSRDDKQFEKDLRKAMLVSQKVDTSLVVVNEYAEMDTSNETTPHCEDNDNHREVDTSYEDKGEESSSSDDESDHISKPLIKEKTHSKKRSQMKQTEKENTSPDPCATSILLPDPVCTPTGVSPVAAVKKPFWKPPGKAGGKATPSPLAASSSYKPTPGTIGNQSGSGMRVGLSRNERVKSLHQNIKNN